MFGDICGSPLVLLPRVNLIHFGQHEKSEDGLKWINPGPAGLTRFTAAGAAILDKIYS